MSESVQVELLTIEEAAAELRVSKSTVLRAVNGSLPGTPRLAAARLGRRILVRRESLDRYLEALEKVNSAA